MKEPWYRLHFSTLVVAGLVVSAVVYLNSRATNAGVTRVYLTEDQSLRVAYDITKRGWPEAHEISYSLSDEHTTMLGHPRKKFIEDEVNKGALARNMLLALGLIAVIGAVAEVVARLIPERKPVVTPTRPVRSRRLESSNDLPRQA